VSTTEVSKETAIETPKAPTVEVKLEVVVILSGGPATRSRSKVP